MIKPLAKTEDLGEENLAHSTEDGQLMLRKCMSHLSPAFLLSTLKIHATPFVFAMSAGSLPKRSGCCAVLSRGRRSMLLR